MIGLFLALVALQTPPAQDAAVELARRTLARELSIDFERVVPARTIAVTWPDSGLGCSDDDRAPEPTPGYRVFLKVEGSVYRVHVGAGRGVICGRPLSLAQESPRREETEPEEATLDPALAPLVETAQKDLARRLRVGLDEIEVVESKTVVWPDGSLGCPEEGMVYPQVLVDGALVRLRYEGRTYDYHSGGSRTPFLCEDKKKR